MLWKPVVEKSLKILRQNDGDLYDDEFNQMTEYIKNLEQKKPGSFRSSHWATFDLFIEQIPTVIYYVSREDFKDEYGEIHEYVNGLLSKYKQ